MRWTKSLAKGFVFIAFALIAFEVGSYFASKQGLFLINETPKLYRREAISDMSEWWTEKEDWGAWHKANSISRMAKPCFSIDLISNEVGARDDSFEGLKSKDNIILVGDSFAEGYGVKQSETSGSIVEREIDRQVLNFGTSGGFGPLQYWLIYNKLAKYYPHNLLIIYFLPANDFTDNDYDYWLKSGLTYYSDGTEHYRPYIKKIEAKTYTYFYPLKSKKADNYRWDPAKLDLLRNFVYDSFWFVNAIRTFNILNANRKIEGIRSGRLNEASALPYSGYYDASEEQQNAVIYYLSKLASESAAKNVVIFSIPTSSDVQSFLTGRKRESMTWYKELKNLEAGSHQKIKYIDLLDQIPIKNYKELYLSCDGHWSEAGNKWAASIVKNAIIQLDKNHNKLNK